MDFIVSAPVWLVALLIFVSRVTDVSLGTVRTVSIVKGHIALSMVLGFFEVGIWITVIAQLITRLSDSWVLVIAYAGGFSAGNGVGILIERRLALGIAVVRMFSGKQGGAIAAALREAGYAVTTIQGEGAKGPVTLIYVAGPRRQVRDLLATAHSIDKDLFFVIEPAYESSRRPALRLRPVGHPTGWRAVAKKK